jgi:hypothetical protein
MKTSALLIALLLGGSSLTFAKTTSAFDAVKVLPKAEAKRLARIEARRGTPIPERWHLLVHDSEAESGLREYVIAAGEIIASRTVSQFADRIAPEDVIADAPLKIDSDEAAEIAQQYALANGLAVASMSYELKREGQGATPLWRVTCLNDEGAEVGALILTATRGTVISHPGFSIDPETFAAQSGGEFRPQHHGSIAGNHGVVEQGVAAPATVAAKTPAKKKSSKTKKKTRKPPPNFIERTGDTLQKFFTGGN